MRAGHDRQRRSSASSAIFETFVTGFDSVGGKKARRPLISRKAHGTFKHEREREEEEEEKANRGNVVCAADVAACGPRAETSRNESKSCAAGAIWKGAKEGFWLRGMPLSALRCARA